METSQQAPVPAHASGGARRAIERAAHSASALLLAAILLMLNYLAFRHYQRFDWTAQGLYTLSPKSKTVLRSLKKDIDVYVFLSRGEPSYVQTDELLKRYTAASPNIHVHSIDPDRQASEFKLLAQRFGISAGVIESGEAVADVAAVVAQGDKNWHISRDDLVSSDLGMGGDSSGEEEVQIKGEQALTGAIVQVTSGRPTKLCVTTGHGEWSLKDGAERSLSSLKLGLHHDNVEWESYETLGQKTVPTKCDVVAVLGPLHAFSDAETKLLMDYVHAGGNLLLALDPVIEHDEVAPTGFEGPLRELGIRLDSDVAIELDRDHLITRNPAEFVLTEFGDHVTTRPLQHAARVFVTLARSVTPISKDGNVDILMRTSDKGFGKTQIAELNADAEPSKGPADIAGPVSIAVATRVGKSAKHDTRALGGRVVVIGDSDFLQGPLLESAEFANFHIASSFLGWLGERPALIDIPPKKIKSGNIVFSQQDLWALFFRVAVLVPAAALILGVAVWLNRRA